MNFDNNDSQLMLVIKKGDLQESLLEFAELIKQQSKKEKIWITPKETMELLNIKSKTTLQNIRDMGLIEFTQPMKKIILFKRSSVLEYLDKYKQKTF